MNYKIITLVQLVLLLGGFSGPIGASQVVTTDQNESTESWYAQVSREDLLALTNEDPQVRTGAEMIIERTYEQKPRALKNSEGKNPYGLAFPLYPEVVAQLMKSVKGKTVLEIGAGYGEIALLLALAGAQCVYINDIQEENFIPLKRDIATLPQSYRDCIHMLKGDCLDLKNNTELNQSCDLIIARNIVNFFTGKKRDHLFKMIARLLKPGGQVVISVNAPFKVVPRELIKQHPDTSLFSKLTPMLSLPRKPREPFCGVGEFSVPSITNVDPLKYSFTPLVTFTSQGIKKHPSFEGFSENWQQRILEYAEKLIKDNGVARLLQNDIYLECHTCYLVFYTKRTLPGLLNNTPLRLIQALYTDYPGHTTNDEAEACGLTVVLKKEIEKACFVCGQNATQRCSRCKKIYFCDRECQLAGWKQHKKECTVNL